MTSPEPRPNAAAKPRAIRVLPVAGPDTGGDGAVYALFAAGATTGVALDGLGRTCVVVPRMIDRVASFTTRLVPRRLASKIAGNAIRKVIGD